MQKVYKIINWLFGLPQSWKIVNVLNFLYTIYGLGEWYIKDKVDEIIFDKYIQRDKINILYTFIKLYNIQQNDM